MTANRKKEKIRYNPRLQNFFTSKWIHVIINPLCEFTYGRNVMLKKTKKSKESVQGFTLVELIIIVAILGVLVAILAPAYTKYIEKSREATDLANAKSAYNELMMNVAEKEEDPEPISFKLKQKHPGWQSPLPITVGSASFDGTNTDNWVGTPGRNGTCVVSYDKNKGVIFTWSGGIDVAVRPTYNGKLDETLTTLKKGYKRIGDANMNNNKAFFSNQTFYINGERYTTRVYYADSSAFKDALIGYTPKPASYDQSPFRKVEHDYDHFTHQGFAYYTYGKDGSINMFTYVNENKVYQTTDEGKTWQDITPNEK